MALIGNIKGEPGVPGSGGVPVGAIIPWMGLLAGLPIPTGFQLCDGSAIVDSESPFNGFNTPPLNGTTDNTKRFLRGSSNTVGASGGSSQHQHLPGTYMCTSSNPATGGGSGPICGANVQFGPGSGGSPVTTLDFHLPPYFDIEFIMRIK